MGPATVQLNGSAEPEDLEREVEGIRDNISGIVEELDRRGHELVDWRFQLRKHALLFGAVGAGCLFGLAVALAHERSRRKRRNRPLAKARRLGDAIARMVAHPELVAQPRPSIARKALGAATSAAVGMLAKAVLSQALDGQASVVITEMA